MADSCLTFGALVDAHQAEVLRYLRRLTGNAADAEDLFQETFLRALPAFRRLRRGTNHRAWVYRIATNVFLNHRRRLGRRSEVPLEGPLPSVDASPAARYRVRMTAEVCRRAICALPPKQRAAFVQRNVLGWNYAQIADALGEPVTPPVRMSIRRRADCGANLPRSARGRRVVTNDHSSEIR